MTERSILITGASSGIGFAAAEMLKGRGWRVIATARKPDDIERLRLEEGLDVIPLELTDEASVKHCAAAALRLTDGRLTALFNNAAFGQVGAVEDLPTDLLRQQFEVNVFAAHTLARAILPAMRANGSGRIVQCSSVLGLMAAPYRGAYCASKFALEALSDSMRLELAGTGVHVCLIEPGPIRTNFVAAALARFRETIDIERSPHRAVYMKRLESMEGGGTDRFKLEPSEVVFKLIHALESPKPQRRYYVTTPTHIAAAFKRVLPPGLLDKVAARS
ncbi:MAG: SDR family NAD(P)-dependent oxidoreductase [Hyphomicrobiaceae bacterium]|nr:SDR family NAD(P)-dependent oxidoreductase [Hyphomicrobiaceae bacterium]